MKLRHGHAKSGRRNHGADERVGGHTHKHPANKSGLDIIVGIHQLKQGFFNIFYFLLKASMPMRLFL